MALLGELTKSPTKAVDVGTPGMLLDSKNTELTNGRDRDVGVDPIRQAPLIGGLQRCVKIRTTTAIVSLEEPLHVRTVRHCTEHQEAWWDAPKSQDMEASM